MARSKELVPGVGRLSRSQVFARRALYKGIKKTEKPAATEAATTKEVQVGGEKNSAKRLVPTSKAPRFYPAEDVRQPKKSRKSPKPTKLRSSITPGTVLILLAGRFRGKRVVFLKQLSSGLLLVTGPYKVNGVPLRRVNQAYVIATSTKLDLGDFKVDEKISDSYFAKPTAKGHRSAEAEFFSEGKPKEKEAFPESKSSDQKAVDAAVIAAVKKTESLNKYLKANGFLDLAIALPLPPILPPYSTTIIVVTVVSRLFFTVPFSVWAKNRQWRVENLVNPQLRQEISQLQKKAVQDMRHDGFRGDRDAALAEVNKRSNILLKARRTELLKTHRCSSFLTMLVPPLTQLPLFVGFSLVLNNASQSPSVLDSESFLTLTSLSHSDPTATLPIVLGLITLANVETARWFAGAAALEREKKVEKWAADRRAKGETVVEPRKVVQASLRALSVARILIASVVPGSIQVYWVVSAGFGLVQSWTLDWWHARRTQARHETPAGPSQSTS
ncbi:uncharacterized protein FIBRA_05289 [Fibroporia radiculosa]|uniref:60S ribosomal protein L6 n=1 Tax=Fibroporia radiculosa TaxID=599839 RepID=J4HX96_9APHY|nr:uncharacterized protein FIBRA_05289 [Fibroporia radiculosa]CCM03167.1 predicted protein [Fibroporia radiculosa]